MTVVSTGGVRFRFTLCRGCGARLVLMDDVDRSLEGWRCNACTPRRRTPRPEPDDVARADMLTPWAELRIRREVDQHAALAIDVVLASAAHVMRWFLSFADLDDGDPASVIGSRLALAAILRAHEARLTAIRAAGAAYTDAMFAAAPDPAYRRDDA